MRLASPPSSAPSTLSVALVPLVGFELAAAGVAIVGGVPATTLTIVLPLTLPLVAVIVPPDDGVGGATNSPVSSIVPTVVDQVTLAGMSFPNWSLAEAVKRCCPPARTDALAGAIAIVVTFGALVSALVATRSIASYVTLGWRYDE